MESTPEPLRADPWLASVAGAVAVIGAITLVAGTLVAGVVVPGHDPLADTVSDLAAGRAHWIMDFSLYGYAAGLIGLALTAADRRLDGAPWTAGVLMIAFLGLAVTVIGARDEYGDGAEGGPVVHIYLVYALAALYVAAPLCLARGLRRTAPWCARLSQGTAAFWIVVGPLFFLTATDWDGLVERLLGIVAAIWTASIAATLIRSAVQADAGAGAAEGAGGALSRTAAFREPSRRGS